MSAETSSSPICTACGKSEATIGEKLKYCSKCHDTPYCSRDCQKQDWRAHKTTCSGMPARKVPPCVIDNPFHRLDNGTYLHDRPEKDVHKLLIDCYRMKLDDDYTFDGDVAEDSLYGGAAPTKGFKRFLRQAERRAGVLPNWWNAGKAKECVATGARKDEEWTSLHAAVEKSDINDHHKNPQMAMQLRMLAEGITGRGPGGQDSAPMRKMMMSMESGSFQGESSMMDASKMFK